MSDDRPLVLEVQMNDAAGNPTRYRVLQNPPARLIFESYFPAKGFHFVAPGWESVQSAQTISTLVSVGGQAGRLSIDDLEAVKLTAAPDQARLDSALFVTPKLAPCGSCGDWNPIDATVCSGCSKDPRRIVVDCPRCEGAGEVMAREGNLLRDCPSCDGTKVEETSTGTARFRYLRRCVDAKILTEEEAGAAFIEE